MKRYLPPIMFLAAFFLAFSASAQLRESDISLLTYPAYPSSGQSVKAVLTSQSVDLDKTLITWSLDGTEKIAGIGKKEFQFNSGNLGGSLTVSAYIELASGGSVTKTIRVSPAEVDMLWQADDSYVPPFYKGKSLSVSQGSVKVVAMPSLRASAKNLSYSWTLDGKGQPQYSGWGKNYMIFTNSYLDRQNEVNIQVSDIMGSGTAAGRAIFYTESPKILFYRKDQALGTDWTRALSDGFSIKEGGETIVAEPYFFSRKDLNSSDLSFSWTLNGKGAGLPFPKNELSVRPEGGEHGSASLSLAVENVKTLFQSASKSLRVEF